jgi:hypothetical protein
MKTDEAIKFFEKFFPGLQVLWYTFDRGAINNTGTAWYRDETLEQFQKRRTASA